MKNHKFLTFVNFFRLSRKQLPAADENFIVTYAPLTDATGADVDWIYAGSGSMSPSSAKMKANAIYRSRLHSAEPIFFHTRYMANYY